MIRLILSVLFLLIATTGWSSEGQPYEGRLQITTERFTIIFEPQDTWAAREITVFADEVFEELTTVLDHVPTRKIPVVITSRPVNSNGYYSPFPPKVTLYITSPANRFLGSRTSSWLRSLFVHELTHYIHLTAPVGPAKYLTPVFGPDVPAMNSILMPGWWVEGITTYMESNLQPGGRGDSPTFAFTYEAPLNEQSMWSLSKGAYNSLNPPRGRIYTTGYLMLDHLYDTYGPEAFVKINKRFAAWPFFGMNPAIKKVTGKSSKEVYADALSQASENILGKPEMSPLFSPDTIGNYYLPYMTDFGLVGQVMTPDKGDQLVRYTPQQQNPESLLSFAANGAENSSISRDGLYAYITFMWRDTATRENIPLVTTSYSDLYRYDFTTDKFSRITFKERLTHPTVSPDGKTVVAIESVEDRYRLVSIDVTTGDMDILYENPGGSIYQPSFSPNGNLIVAIEIVSGESTLLLFDSEGATIPLWPYSDAEIHNPRFIDNQTIWFGSDLEGRLALYEIDSEGNQLYRLLGDPIGIVGAIPWKDRVIYGTYTTNGYALRDVPINSLERNPIDLIESPGPSIENHPQDSTDAPEFTTSRYHDYLRFNVWVPVTMNIPELVPGATAMFKSILGKQVLQVSAGYQIEKVLPVANITYQFAPGPYTLTLEGNLNEAVDVENPETRVHSLSGTVNIPLWNHAAPDAKKNLSVSLSTGAALLERNYSVSGFGYLTYRWQKSFAPKDYFGSASTSISAGMRGDYSSIDNSISPLIMGSIRGQLPIGNSHQVFRMDIDGGVSLSGRTVENLNPIGFSVDGQGETSALLTARYRIPFGIIDQPIPYGGIIGMGLTLHGQRLVHLHEGSFFWGDDFYTGLTLNATIAIGAAFTFNATGGIALSISDPTKPRFIVGFNFANLFGGEQNMITRVKARN